MGFDYQSLPVADRAAVKASTARLRVLLRRAAEGIVEAGQELLKVKERLGHGRFGLWLAAEFPQSQATAGRFMAVARTMGGQIPHGAEFEARALYLLASPSTPESARQEAVNHAANGQTVTLEAAGRIVRAASLREAVRNLPPEAQKEVMDRAEREAAESARRAAVRADPRTVGGEGRRDRLARIGRLGAKLRTLIAGLGKEAEDALEHLDACLSAVSELPE